MIVIPAAGKICKVCAGSMEHINRSHAKYCSRSCANKWWRMCNREEHLARRRAREVPKQRLYRYGVSPEQFDEMLSRQGGVCAICDGEFVREPCLDHDHKTGRVRGVLCNNCNVGISRFSDDPETLIRAAEYLK